MNQQSLFDQPEDKPRKRRLTIEERFTEWARENPEVVEIYLKYAREARNSGRRRYGIAAITERVRWHMNIQTVGDDFKINNNHRAPMARLLAKLDPSLAELFETRTKAT
jgi:hypothetical protein